MSPLTFQLALPVPLLPSLQAYLPNSLLHFALLPITYDPLPVSYHLAPKTLS
jgi:hypothetical protein